MWRLSIAVDLAMLNLGATGMFCFSSALAWRAGFQVDGM